MSSIIELNKDVETYVLQAGHPRAGHYFKDETVPLTLLHLSDVHAARGNWERMVEYANHYKDYIDLVLCTGDYCGGSHKQYVDMYTVAACERPIYNCTGNHDCTTGDWTLADKTLTYEKLFNHTEGWDVTFAPVPQPMSYYKDFPASNVRLIVLDDYYHVWETRVWLRELLADALDKGLHVITAQHEPTDYIHNTYGSRFHTLDDYTGAFKGSELRRKAPCYDNRGRVLYEDVIGEFIGKGGIYVCNLAGHDHVDQFGLTDHGVLNVTVQNAKCCNLLGDTRRVPGTKTEDCFNLFSVDTVTGVFKIVRVGANVDRYLRPRTALCFDYINKRLISEA